jgi:hypothetical protein
VEIAKDLSGQMKFATKENAWMVDAVELWRKGKKGRKWTRPRKDGIQKVSCAVEKCLDEP